MPGIDRQRLERVARIYASNQDASQALGIEMRSFGRLCRQYGIETPYARRRRRLQEGKKCGKGENEEGQREQREGRFEMRREPQEKGDNP